MKNSCEIIAVHNANSWILKGSKVGYAQISPESAIKCGFFVVVVVFILFGVVVVCFVSHGTKY